MSNILDQISFAPTGGKQPAFVDLRLTSLERSYEPLTEYVVSLVCKSVIAVPSVAHASEAVCSLRSNFANYLFGEYRAPLREAQRAAFEGDRVEAFRILEEVIKSMEI